MKQILSGFILSALIVFSTFAQYYQPQSPLVFDRTQIQQSNISQKITSVRKIYSSQDIEELKFQIIRHNNEVDRQIASINNKMSNISMDKQDLLKLVDIKKMQEQITVKEASLKQIKQEIENDLASLTYQGLFLVVLNNIDPLGAKGKLAKQAEELLAPKAIEDLNGVFISSLTIVQNSRLQIDQIKGLVSGEMAIDRQFISKTTSSRSKFVYLVKVKVTPLKKPIVSPKPPVGANSQHLVLNVLSAANYRAQLQQAGLPDEDIKNVESEVNSSRDVIQDANQTTNRIQQSKMEQGNNNLERIETEIQQLRNSLTNRSQLLQQIITQRTTIVYKSNNIEGTIQEALQYFERQLNSLKAEKIAIKEKELITKYEVGVSIEGEPSEDLAKSAIDLSKQINQSYSKVEQFFQETEVMNNMLVSDKAERGMDVFRQLEQIWLYPVPGGDNFLLSMVAKFKITPQTNQPPAPARSGVRETSPPPPPTHKYADEKIFVQGGTFIMGSNDGEGDEKPSHKVYVDDFYISKTEVTNAQFCEFLNEKGNQTEGGVTWLDIESTACKINRERGRYVPASGFENHPVVIVSWYGARAYAQWTGGQLPTEAEWEYAARGGNKSNGYTYSGGNNIDVVAWYNRNSGSQTHPVAQKQPNELGIYDMSGNVWEWCADWYDGNYYNSNPPYENPKGPATGSDRVLRGGSWYGSAQHCRSAFRSRDFPESRDGYIGFRLVFVP